mgnify:CR=1 FL=1
MADTAKRAYGPAAPATTAATAYTVPASTTFILKQIHASNGTASSATVTASIGLDAAGTRVLDALTVPANGTYTLDTWIPMAATEVIQVKQGTASACTLTITGVEVT